MKRIDCHLHIHTREGQDTPEQLIEKLHAAGFDGAIVIGDNPASFKDSLDEVPIPNDKRLENLFAVADGHPELYPFYWLDPFEEDLFEQIDKAIERGVYGFKCIPNFFFVGDERPMEVWRYIAKTGKPVMFHSGILWDSSASANFTRPINYEPLLFIPGFKFSMAHVSWPWCDEMIALYGKASFLKRANGDKVAELYIDLTPGTPPPFRAEVFHKLFGSGKIFSAGYPLDHIMFGTDNRTFSYNVKGAKEWIERDMAIYEELELDRKVIDDVYGGAFLRFIGAEE